jgi:hypothetical protein
MCLGPRNAPSGFQCRESRERVAAIDAVVDRQTSNERNHTLGLSLARPLSQNGLNSKAMQELAANWPDAEGQTGSDTRVGPWQRDCPSQ